MESNVAKIKFDRSGYYFIGLVALVLLGFWPTYFARFIDGTANFTHYFHFHSSIAALWIILLIVQPLLIRKKKFALHRAIGKASYFVFPLLFLSIILLAHSRHPVDEKNLDLRLFIPFKDLLILGTAYFIAIRYRHITDVHARAMIATGIVFIEPALARFIKYAVVPPPVHYYITVFLIYCLLTGLIMKERNQQKGRWVFPLILGLYIIVHSVFIFKIHIGPWAAFAHWFASLPLT